MARDARGRYTVVVGPLVLSALLAVIPASAQEDSAVPKPAPVRTAVAEPFTKEDDPDPEEDGLKRRIVKLAGPGDFPKRLPRYARQIMLEFLLKGDKDQMEYGVSVSTALYRDGGRLRYQYRLFFNNTVDPKHSVRISAQFRENDLFNFHTHPINDAGVPSYCPDQKNPTWGDLSTSITGDRDGMHAYVVGSKFVAGYADGKVRAVYDLKTGKKLGTNIYWKDMGEAPGCEVSKERRDGPSYVIETEKE